MGGSATAAAPMAAPGGCEKTTARCCYSRVLQRQREEEGLFADRGGGLRVAFALGYAGFPNHGIFQLAQILARDVLEASLAGDDEEWSQTRWLAGA